MLVFLGLDCEMSIVLPQSERIRLERILHSANDLPVAFFKPAQVRIYVSRCKRNVFSFCSTPSGPGYLRVVSYSYVSFHLSNDFFEIDGNSCVIKPSISNSTSAH